MGIFWFLYFVLNHTLLLAAGNTYYRCYSNGNFSSDSQYIQSRNGLLSALADDVKQQGGFYIVTAIVNPPTPVPNCLGLCRKDLISSDDCYNCISSSASDLTLNCPVQKQIIAWGADADCVVQCIPPATLKPQTDDIQPSQHVCNATGVSLTNLSRFKSTLANLTAKLAVRVAAEGTSSSFPSGYNEPQYFATEKAKFGDLQTIYAGGYCIPSLSASDCTSCLKGAANQSDIYCKEKNGASIFTPGCVLRYELYQFYKSTNSIVAPPPSVSPSSKTMKKNRSESRTILFTIILPTIIIVTLLVLIIIIGTRMILKRRKQHWDQKVTDEIVGDGSIDLCFEFSINTIRSATNDFSESNKLGQGGFGVVYRGRLPNGLLVAVKRLTCRTAHGEAEFRNEVQLVARLHHRNLVRLIGFCLGVKERILIYELALTGSLDHILFNPDRRENLTWKIRYNIIEGIARGLLYLHEESQLRIIHRDLKASNVLLDASMNPKISDFGTARLFLEDHGSASKIVGTYGYMPPEYAKYGKISTKVDVFSFGVLLLEIVTGRKNSASDNPRRFEHLLSKVWKCWKAGQLLELIDPMLLRENEQVNDITRCIHIGLLCVQENVGCRPIMNDVVLVLEGCSQSLPSPSEPAYLMETVSDEASTSTMASKGRASADTDQATSGLPSLSSSGFASVNEVSFSHTYPEPR